MPEESGTMLNCPESYWQTSNKGFFWLHSHENLVCRCQLHSKGSLADVSVFSASGTVQKSNLGNWISRGDLRWWQLDCDLATILQVIIVCYLAHFHMSSHPRHLNKCKVSYLGLSTLILSVCCCSQILCVVYIVIVWVFCEASGILV